MTPGGLTGFPVAPERAATRARLWWGGGLPLSSPTAHPVARPCGPTRDRHTGGGGGAHVCLKSGFPNLDLSCSFSVLLIKKPVSLRVEGLFFSFFPRVISPDGASITRFEIKLAGDVQCYSFLLFLSAWW